MQSQLSSSPPPRRPLFRARFLLGFFVALTALCIIYWNRFQMWEMLRYYQTPEPERSQRKAFADQMDAFQSSGRYRDMRVAAAQWRKTHPADPNGYASEGFAAYYLGDVDKSIAAWQKAASMDSLIVESANKWIEPASQAKINWGGPLPPAVLMDGDVTARDKAGKKCASLLLSARKYDEIERVAASLLASKTESCNGTWDLTSFYWGLSDVDNEASWQIRKAQLEAWRKARPHSLLARLAVASCWVNGAWLARGEGYASGITPEGAAQMKQRVQSAALAFRDLRGNETKSPLFVAEWQMFAQLAGVSGTPYDAVVERGVRAFPTYNQIVRYKCSHLLPRWYGEEGDWQTYATQRADQMGGVTGDILYARVIWYMYTKFSDGYFWRRSKASWPRAQKGFEALLKSDPKSLSTATVYFALARDAGDKNLARRILKTYIQGRADRAYWQKLSYFLQARMSVLRD